MTDEPETIWACPGTKYSSHDRWDIGEWTNTFQTSCDPASAVKYRRNGSMKLSTRHTGDTSQHRRTEHG